MITGKQVVWLGNGKCFDGLGSSFHELQHTLGFDHEQSRHDRDSYVEILRDNVEPGMEANFQKFEEGTSFDVPYDYGSVMHYSLFAFSKNDSLPTIKPLVRHSTGV